MGIASLNPLTPLKPSPDQAMVLKLQMAKKHFFGIITPGNLQNRGSDQKVLEVWPPKSEVSKAN